MAEGAVADWEQFGGEDVCYGIRSYPVPISNNPRQTEWKGHTEVEGDLTQDIKHNDRRLSSILI